MNLFNQNQTIVGKYKNIRETFNVIQHISLLIRKDEKLIDHIISNTTF